MTISANSVFHFTKTLDNLKGLLGEGFRVKYCREKVAYNNAAMELMVPMVSFCDIPLSEIKEHLDKYGNYGIGLGKMWAEKNGLNPVIYLQRKSAVGASYIEFLKHYVAQGHGEVTDPERAIIDIFRYTKNYSGDLYRNQALVKLDYRFYDEREWRYVPHYTRSFDMVVSPQKYNAEKAKYDEKLKDLRLKFEPSDVNYIIIKEDADFGDLLDFYSELKCAQLERDSLLTRLITVQQIQTDF